MKACQKLLVPAVLSVVAAFCLLSCDPPASNDGQEVGYYADFNRVSNALVSIPGVMVTNFWMNRDITLEEFGFDVTTATGRPVHIAVGEVSADSDESGHLFQSISDTIPGLSDSCRSEATL